VADYDSSSGEDDDDDDDDETLGSKEEEKENGDAMEADLGNSQISDEEDFADLGGVIDDDDGDFAIGLSSGPSLFASLPSTTSSAAAASGFVDEDEDLQSIPKASESERADAALKPVTSTMAKKRRNGPVKIVLPTLAELEDDRKVSSVPKPRAASSTAKSMLLSILPAPKNSVAVPKEAAALPPVAARSTGAAAPKAPSIFVPDSVARRKRAAANAPTAAKKKRDHDEDSSDDEGVSPSSFFALDSVSAGASLAAASVASASLAAEVAANAAQDVDDDFVPEHAILVGPSRPTPSASSVAMAYPSAEDLTTNEAALERLAGKNALRNKEKFDFVEVAGDSLTADPREWLTKALTEEDTDKPGPRCDVKGQTKRKHQITYLAALAKENEHKLKQQWATNAQNKRAAGSKYGF
jgi:hypothetical protein